MTIVGYFLAFLNILAAAGFVYIATLDLAKRQLWAYAAFRHERVLEGLPFDSQEVDDKGAPLVENLSEATLQQMFQPVGGDPVKTQSDEVKKVHDQMRQQLDALADENARRKKLAAWFISLARSNGVRDDLAEKIGFQPDGRPAPAEPGKKAPLDKLLAEFDALFDVDGKDWPRFTPPLLKSRRQAVAYLLYNLKPGEEAHQRLQVVVGLKALAEVAYNQAPILNARAEMIRFYMLGDRADFEVEYQRGVDNSRALADSIVANGIFQEQQKSAHQDHVILRDGRQDAVKKAKEALEAIRQLFSAALKEQFQEEKKVFQTHKVLGTVVRENEKLEIDIRTLEKGRR